MRVYLIGFAITLVMLVPTLARLNGWDLPPAAGWLFIPVTGLNYIITFFHELGHFFALWFFGYPAFPAFDFVNGGGVTVGTRDPSMIVLGLVYIGFAYTCWLQWKGGEIRMLMIVGSVALLHIIASLTKWHEIIPTYMGHGGEMLVAGFCILRAGEDWPNDARGRSEKYLNMVFGLYTLLHNLLMNIGLMTSAARRQEYAMAKGGHMVMDFDTIAEILRTRVEYVAGASTVFLLVCVALIVWLAITRPWQET